jgi:hypothetical protein
MKRPVPDDGAHDVYGWGIDQRLAEKSLTHLFGLSRSQQFRQIAPEQSGGSHSEEFIGVGADLENGEIRLD